MHSNASFTSHFHITTSPITPSFSSMENPNRLKTRIRRIFQSCKSKNSITYDVLDSTHHHNNYLIEQEQDYHTIFSPNHLLPPFTINQRFIINNPTYTTFSPSSYYLTNSENHQIINQLDGPNCPPVSPIISPLNVKPNLYHLQCKDDAILGNKPKNKFQRGSEHNGGHLYSGGGGRELKRSSSLVGISRNAEDEMQSLAVVKRSSDPYADFRASMMEMIVQNQIFATKDLRDLLKCFLSLNSSHYHTLILQVFDEISQSLHHHRRTMMFAKKKS